MATEVAEFCGYVASLLVVAAFDRRRMLPLRLDAIASNIAFVTYAWIDDLRPILLLHGALLPLNLLRLYEIYRLHHAVARASTEEFSVAPLLPLMKRTTFRAAETLFEANDPADELYYVLEGVLFLPELQQEVRPGSFLGEFALFSDAGRRTATAIARTDCVAMVLTRKAALAAITHHPPLAIYLLRLITMRMLQNAGRHIQSWPPPADVQVELQVEGQDERRDEAPPPATFEPPANAAAPVVSYLPRP